MPFGSAAPRVKVLAMRLLRYRLALLLVALPTSFACHGDGLVVPDTGTLEVTTSTTGTAPDPDGYTVQLDAEQPRAIAVTGSLQSSELSPGHHSVLLGGIAPNCSVADENPRTVNVTAGEISPISFEVTCTAVTGNLRITMAATGVFGDPNGYTVLVDGTDRGKVAWNSSIVLKGIAAASHSLGLADIAEHCHVDGENPRMVEVQAGISTDVTFNTNCAATPVIAFVSNGPGLLAILLMNADGSGVRTLTDGSVPTWSPDKTRIAFFAFGIEVIGIDGSGRMRLTEDLTQELRQRILPDPLQWSPDGTTIAFTVDASALGEGCCPVDLWLARADGGGTRMLVADGSSPSWSPDGLRIAFTSSRDGNDEIYVINSDGSGLKRLTERPGFRDLAPRWSPDGTTLVFETQVISTSFEIAIMDADGTGLMNLTGGRASEGSPVWLGNGAKIGFEADGQIGLMNPDGSGRTIVTDVEGMHFNQVAWSPDGSQVAFVKNDPAGALLDPELYVIKADGTGLRNISNRPTTYEMMPDW
jgi:Tol biopolymer transport system component